MSFKLRPYQQEAVDKVVEYAKKRIDPCLLSLATGSGKSLIVANLAMFFAKAAPNKRVICIAPSKELVEQNAEKYASYGYPASIYCASAKSKCLRSQVIFVSPGSAIKQIDKIAHLGISAIIIDEAHNVTETMKKLVSAVRDYEFKGKKPNEKVRVIGMTATPYRMSTGYIYAVDSSGETDIYHGEDKAIEPYYNRLLYSVTAGYLVGEGFLTNPTIGETSEHYDTSKLETDKFGNFSAKSVASAFNGNTKTERIIQRVVATVEQKNLVGVMVFAATISHAEEVAGYLPAEQTAIVTGKTKAKDRQQIIELFKARKLKYLVNVDVLTTGFDAPHVDFVVIMRATESAGLLQQIIGRGLRLDPNKETVLIHDYAENIERHGLQSDIFTPEIRTRKASSESTEIDSKCPACGVWSSKKRRNDQMYDGLKNDEFGHFLVAGTNIVLTTQVLDPTNKDEFGVCGTKEVPVPAHYSRRCSNPEAYAIDGKSIQCGHRYAFKTCPSCFEDNDIAARHCTKCKGRLVDPNAKLTENAGSAVVMAEGETCEVVCLGAEYAAHKASSGSVTLKATYKTELGAVTAWHSKKQQWIFNRLCRANGVEPEFVNDFKDCEKWREAPKFVKIKKSIQNGFTRFEVKEVRFV